ncbi:hypothetical protein [Planomonospora sp. ID82291]|uniref:hypothetical protein n=1 Tax=Planomonospora sp. ID82291 TaxID=2738136 RepID=UPI0018C42C40|nr:hypothetical protein [Planomonospora sp. ID82291]MBG0819059.1 hypothetical protein [Planomonospora sp. ID82291]
MRASTTAAAVLVATLATSTAASAQMAAEAWEAGKTGVGHVSVSADRRQVTACDAVDDRTKVAIQYRTTIGRVIVVQAGPKKRCAFDSIIFGSVERAKFCYGPGDADLAGVNTLRHCYEAEDL